MMRLVAFGSAAKTGPELLAAGMASLALGLYPYGAFLLLARGYYALGDSRTPGDRRDRHGHRRCDRDDRREPGRRTARRWSRCSGSATRRRTCSGSIVLGIGCRRRTGQSIIPAHAPDLDRDLRRDRVRGVDRDPGASIRTAGSRRSRASASSARSAPRVYALAMRRWWRAPEPDRVRGLMRRSLVLAFAVVALFASVGISSGRTASPSSAAPASADRRRTTTTLPGPEDDSPGSPAGARDLAPGDLVGGPRPRRSSRTSRALFAKSAVADLSVRGVRPGALARRRLRHDRRRHPIGRPHRQRRRVPRARRAVRRRDRRARRWRAATASPTSTIPTVVDPVPRAAPDRRAQQRSPVRLQVSVLGDTLAAAGVQRAVIGNADTTLDAVGRTPTTGAGPPLALTDQNGIVPAGDVGTSLLERDPDAPFGLRLDPQRVLAAFDRDVERAIAEPRGGRRRGQRSPPAAVVRLVRSRRSARAVMQQQVLAQLDALVGQPDAAGDRRTTRCSWSRRRSAVARAGSRSRASPRRACGRVSRSRAGPATRASSRSSTSGRRSSTSSASSRPTRMEGRPITFGRTGGDLAVAPDLADRHQQGRAVPRPRDLPGHGLVRRAPDRADRRRAGRVRSLRPARPDRDRAGGAHAARLPRRDVPRRSPAVLPLGAGPVLAVPLRRRRRDRADLVAHDRSLGRHDA